MELTVLNCRIKQSWRHCLTFKMNTLCCYTTLELYTQWHSHIPKELNLAVCCQNCGTTLHHHLRYCAHESVQPHQYLLSVNVYRSYQFWSLPASPEFIFPFYFCPSQAHFTIPVWHLNVFCSVQVPVHCKHTVSNVTFIKFRYIFQSKLTVITYAYK